MPSKMAAEKAEPLNPGDQDWSSYGELPDPELNPMTNPTLSRNLGKWAQVYFTNPPEKRAQAVAELLQELEGTPGGNGTAGTPAEVILSSDKAEKNHQHLPPKTEEIAADAANVPSRLACPECAHINAPDHWFCGFCGSPLKGTALKRDHADLPRSPGQSDNGSALASQKSARQPGDVEWLREKTLARYDAERRPLRKILLATLGIAAIALSYYEWQNRAGAQTPAQASRAVSAAASSSKLPPGQGSGESSESPTSSRSSQSSELLNQPAEHKTGTATVATRAGNTSGTAGNTPQTTQTAPSSPPDVGDRELAIAESFLKGESRARDASEASKWLWKSVSKHNAAALIVLADLYERGDGVAKSCDQAEILLVAAAKNGSSEAGQKLENLRSSDCK